MAYKKKSSRNPVQNLNPEPSISDISGASSDPEPTIVPVEVASHGNNTPSFIDRAKEKLAEMTEGGDAYQPSEEAPVKKKWNKYAPKAKQQEAQQEFATLTSTLIVLGLLAWKAPDTVKPNGDEVNAVSYHLSGIITRHIDISSAMTKDVLDTIGILAVFAAYLTRVSPELKRLQGGDNSGGTSGGGGGGPVSPFQIPPEPAEERVDRSDMPNVSKDTKRFLNNISRQMEE